MPIAAVPQYLGRDFKEASPGMRFGMYLTLWGVNSRTTEHLWVTHDINYRSAGKDNQEREDKVDNKVFALNAAKAITARDKNHLASLLARQQAVLATMPPSQSLSFEALSTAPFTTGLGNEHPLENGFAFLNPYGLPYLPGSGVKGVLRQAARELASGEWGDNQGWNEEKTFAFTIERKSLSISMLDVLFGLESQDGDKEHLRGALTFWDVIPQIHGDSLAVEIMTPHQSHYYQQKNDRKSGSSSSPHDSGQPTPISFLTVTPGSIFSFFITCDLDLLARHAPSLAAGDHWKVLLKIAFEHAFSWLGFGAKTAVGYGTMLSESQRLALREADEKHAEQAREESLRVEEIRQEQQAVAWEQARIQFNCKNGALSVEKGGKIVFAIAPKGKELLETLPAEIQKKVLSNQFVKVTAYVCESTLVRVQV